MSDQVKMTAMNYAIDRPAAENPVKVMDLTFRDGHQSLFATRGRTEDMIPVAEMMDEVGFWALETWGGAPHPEALRQEDPVFHAAPCPEPGRVSELCRRHRLGLC